MKGSSRVIAPQALSWPDSGLRQLQPDFRQAERAYFQRVGSIAGHHVIAFKPELALAHPWILQELSKLIDRSARLWYETRKK